jgi:hypothetical protein
MNEYQTKCLALSKLYAEAAETGRPFQAAEGQFWHTEPFDAGGPDLGTELIYWRVKPAPVVLTIRTYRNRYDGEYFSTNGSRPDMMDNLWQIVDTRDIEIAP